MRYPHPALWLGLGDDGLLAAAQTGSGDEIEIVDARSATGPLTFLVVRRADTTALGVTTGVLFAVGFEDGELACNDAQFVVPIPPMDTHSLVDRILAVSARVAAGDTVSDAVAAGFPGAAPYVGNAPGAGVLPPDARYFWDDAAANVIPADDDAATQWPVEQDWAQSAPPGESDWWSEDRHWAPPVPGQRWQTPERIEVPPIEVVPSPAPALPGSHASTTEQLPPPAEPRLLQTYVNRGGPDEGRLAGGHNTVDVFVGPREVHALVGLEVSDAALGLDRTDEDTVQVAVVLAPLVPPGRAVRADLHIPRHGRSSDVQLAWDLPQAGFAQARLMLLHRNRVLQTALLRGSVGRAVDLVEPVVLWSDGGDLSGRGRFDLTVVLNHDDTGQAQLVAVADEETTIQQLDEVIGPTERLRKILMRATQLTSRGAKATEQTRRILVDAAVEGHELYELLRDHLERFVSAERIQIVTARAGRFLPLELVYDRPAPDEDATVCHRWLEGGDCGADCFAGPDDTSIVCPQTFWGMGRTIERQHGDLTGSEGAGFIVRTSPTRQRNTLHADTALIAASRKVRPVDVAATQKALLAARTATSWDGWTQQLATAASALLVLMPHTDELAATMEIMGTTLHSARLESRYVTGGHDTAPIVMLFGCDTAGSTQNPAGYAARFLEKGAAVAFATLTVLLGRHAAAMARKVGEVLQDPQRSPEPLADLVARFRREAVRDGLIGALAVTAYGDADWQV